MSHINLKGFGNVEISEGTIWVVTTTVKAHIVFRL